MSKKKIIVKGNIFSLWTVLETPKSQKFDTLIKVECLCGLVKTVKKYKLTGKYSNGCKSCMCAISKNKEKEAPNGFKHYKKHIFVSKQGEVFSSKSGKLLSPGFGGSKSEYLRVNIGEKFEYVHRLVALTYIPLEDKRWQVNHKDKNTLNNSVENLEWVTAEENIRHANGEANYKG